MTAFIVKLDTLEVGIVRRLLLDELERAKTPKEQAARTDELALLMRLTAVEAAKHGLYANLLRVPAWAAEALWVAHGDARRLTYVEADREKLQKEVRSLKGRVAQLRGKQSFPKTARVKEPRERVRPGGAAATGGASRASTPEPVIPVAAAGLDDEGGHVTASERG